MTDLFLLLEKGQIDDNGYKYFTCSTSSLERVFMEIVRICEQQEEADELSGFEDNYLGYDSNDSLGELTS